MTERAVRTETSPEAREFDRTWTIAQEAFVEYTCTTTNSADSYRNDLKILRQSLRERDICSWESITTDDLVNFFERKQVKADKPYSLASRARQSVVIRGFFNWINSIDHPINSQTLEAIRGMKISTQTKNLNILKPLLSRSELISIAANPDSRVQALIQLLQSGINPGKLEQLTIANIKDDLSDISQPFRLEVPQRKGKETQWTEITLNKEAGSALRTYLLNREADLNNPYEPLFPSNQYYPQASLTRQGMWFIISRWGEKIGIPCNPHLLAKSARRLTK